MVAKRLGLRQPSGALSCEDFGNVGTVARLKTAFRGLGRFFADARRSFVTRQWLILLTQIHFHFVLLLRRKCFDCSENFSNPAHAGKLSARRFGVNEAKLPAQHSGVSADRRNFCKTKECDSLPRSRYAVEAAYSGGMIFRICRSYGAFRNRGNFLQRFRS